MLIGFIDPAGELRDTDHGWYIRCPSELISRFQRSSHRFQQFPVGHAPGPTRPTVATRRSTESSRRVWVDTGDVSVIP